MKCIRVTVPQNLEKQAEQALKESDNVFVLFFGRETIEGQSWCPDCVVADPKVRAGIAKVENAILLEVPVDRKSDTASDTQVFRQDESIRLERIPTLLRYTAADRFSGARLVEEECHNQDHIDAFVAGLSSRRK